MSTDFRALCAELLRELDFQSTPAAFDLITRARAALAQPEAELPPRPPLATAVDRPDLVRYGLTWDRSPDKPLLTPASDGYWTPWHVAARLPQPIPVSERLPGEGDCDAEGRVWIFDEGDAITNPSWNLDNKARLEELKQMEDQGKLIGLCERWSIAWLPAHALPLPQGEQP